MPKTLPTETASAVNIHKLDSDIELHELIGYIQHIYIAVYADKLLLLDGASKPDVKLILRYIKYTLQRDIAELKLIVITHFHPDHAGAAKALQQATGCQIASRKLPNHWYGGLSGLFAFAIDIYLAGWVASKMKKPKQNLWFNPLISPDVVLENEQCLPGFDDWQVLYTEGHTDRDISILHLPSQHIYVADLFIKTARGFITPFPVYLPKAYRASLERVWSLAPVRYILAHGGLVELTEDNKATIRKRVPKKPRTIKHKTLQKLGIAKLQRHEL